MVDRIVTYMGDGSFLPILLCSRPSLRDCEMLTNLRLKLQCQLCPGPRARGGGDHCRVSARLHPIRHRISSSAPPDYVVIML